MQEHAMFTTQDAVDAAFADLDSLLAVRDAPVQRGCRNCGNPILERAHNDGSIHDHYSVCGVCGAVDSATFGFSDDWSRVISRRCTSNYKRIHHWHERVSQLLLCESRIPEEHFQQIENCIRSGAYTVINKDVIRAVLRSLNMQVYIEKWLQIIWRVSGIEPPKPGQQLLQWLDDAFTELQRPFKYCRNEGRKNFLNYNYVRCRLFQKLGCTQFCMFFPLIKSRQKLLVLDETWRAMCDNLGWEFTPLVQVPPFAVSLRPRDPSRTSSVPQVAAEVYVEMSSSRKQKVFRKSDLRLLRELDRQTSLKQRRSDQLAQRSQTLSKSTKRPRPGPVKLLQSRPRVGRR